METQIIQSKIHTIRGQRVMLDFDLAALYEVEARVLNQSVKRNLRRFPEDFMFQLNKEEVKKCLTIEPVSEKKIMEIHFSFLNWTKKSFCQTNV